MSPASIVYCPGASVGAPWRVVGVDLLLLRLGVGALVVRTGVLLLRLLVGCVEQGSWRSSITSPGCSMLDAVVPLVEKLAIDSGGIRSLAMPPRKSPLCTSYTCVPATVPPAAAPPAGAAAAGAVVETIVEDVDGWMMIDGCVAPSSPHAEARRRRPAARRSRQGRANASTTAPSGPWSQSRCHVVADPRRGLRHGAEVLALARQPQLLARAKTGTPGCRRWPPPTPRSRCRSCRRPG